LSYTIY